MSVTSLMRDYENLSLPLEKRLPSLARRFTCLRDAQGLEPFVPGDLHSWTMLQGMGSAAWHAGHLILNLFGEGPWAEFDAVAALRAFDTDNRSAFVNWARCWR